MIHDERIFCGSSTMPTVQIQNNPESVKKRSALSTLIKKSFLYSIIVLTAIGASASCPTATPWSTPVNLSTTGDVASGIFSAGTASGFMAVWADNTNNAHYSFSSDGIAWQGGLVTPAEGDLASNSDVFVAGNSTGFIVTWIDSSNNAWSSFSANQGKSWSNAIQINPNTLALNGNSDVYVSGSSAGFVATLIGADNNAYVSFSTGTTPWSTPVQVTTNSSVNNTNRDSVTGRQFVGSVVVGNSCMLMWLNNLDSTACAYFTSINPFSSTTVYPIVSVGFFESVPIVAELNGYFMAASRANINEGVPVFSVATIPSNWATFSLFLSEENDPNAGPWVATNKNGFMSTWVVGDFQNAPGSPVWTFSSDNGFNWTPLCPILATPSTTIAGQVALSANYAGFVATWFDTNDSNVYASFYTTASSSSTDIFVTLLQQKYGPLL